MFFLLLLAAALKAAQTAPTSPEAVSSRASPITILGRELDLPSCVDPGRYRTMQEIIWHCLATIFACTWVAFHPNVADPKFSRCRKLVLNATLLALALIVPEYITRCALRQWIGASRHVEKYNTDYFVRPRPPRKWFVRLKSWLFDQRADWRGDEGGYIEGRSEEQIGVGRPSEKSGDISCSTEPKVRWTMTHGFLLEMGGLVAYTLDSKEFREGSRGIITQIDQLSAPLNIPEQHINDRSKRDNLTKFIAALQTSWFILQCIARWISNLPVTQLEVVTLAFAFLNIITYALWWKKPQKMNVAIYIRVQHVPSRALQSSEGIGPFYSTVSQFQRREFVTALCLIAIPFGAIHLIPIWLSSFASPREKLLWTISSIFITVEPAALACFRPLEPVEKRHWKSWVHYIIVAMSTLMFIGARIILLSLAFASLRNSPTEVYYNIDWDSFVPRVY